MVAHALQWAFHKQGVTWVAHYLDNYISINREVMLSSCRRLGVPVVPVKCAGPSTVMVFLGFEIDTNSMVVSMLNVKLQHMVAMV